VLSAMPNCDLTEKGNPTRRAKIRFFLLRKGLADESLEDFVERDMRNVVELFDVFNEGTHGSAGKFDIPQLRTLKRRVEDGIAFLHRVIE
jgi:hypothetical protein